MNMHLREGRSYTREFVEVPGGFRRTVEDAIEALICVLDQLDTDPDLEDGGYNEPTLGWPETGNSDPHGLNKLDIRVLQEDGEIEEACEDEGAQCEDEGAQCDDEGDWEHDADLGWPEAGAGPIPLSGFFGNEEENLSATQTIGNLTYITGSRAHELSIHSELDPRLGRRGQFRFGRIGAPAND